MKTTSIETVSTGVQDKNKENYLRSKDKAEKAHVQSIMSNLQPNCCSKVDFQKVDQHAGGK